MGHISPISQSDFIHSEGENTADNIATSGLNSNAKLPTPSEWHQFDQLQAGDTYWSSRDYENPFSVGSEPLVLPNWRKNRTQYSISPDDYETFGSLLSQTLRSKIIPNVESNREVSRQNKTNILSEVQSDNESIVFPPISDGVQDTPEDKSPEPILKVPKQRSHFSNFYERVDFYHQTTCAHSNTKRIKKYTSRYDIIIDPEHVLAYQISRRLIGAKGCNMKRINALTGAKLRLRGIGSGYFEGINRKEASEPLHLCVSAPNSRAFHSTCEMVERLLAEVGKYYNDLIPLKEQKRVAQASYN